MNRKVLFIFTILIVFTPRVSLFSEEGNSLSKADVDKATREVDRPVLHDIAEGEWAVPQKPKIRRVKEGEEEAEEVDAVTEDSPRDYKANR